MSGESIIVICLVIFGVYGIFKFTKSEETSQAKILKIVQDIRGDITDLSRRIKLVEMEQSSLRANFKNYSKLIEEVSQEVDASQDHLAKMRKTSLELQQRSFPHKVEFNILPPSGPIPIEVFTREPNKKTVTRKVVSKTKTGYKSRLEQRQSVLKGDPNKYSWPTHKKNKETKEH